MGNFINNHPILFTVMIILVVFALIIIGGFLIIKFFTKTDIYNDINEDDKKTNYEEDSNLINKTKGKSKTNI